MRIRLMRGYQKYPAGRRINVNSTTGLGLIGAGIALLDEQHANKSMSGKAAEKQEQGQEHND